MPDIFSYTDYREFIVAWYNEKKHGRPKVTYRIIAEAIGFNSSAHVLMVLRNKAHLPPENAKKLAKFLGLNQKEAKYLIEMVNYSRHRSLEEKKRSMGQMVRLNKKSTILLQPDQYEYYQKWYYAAIHDTLSFYPFKDDFNALAKMMNPPITSREAKKAVALLERLQFIQKKGDGTYTCNYPGISAYAEGGDLALGTYAEAMMDKAKEALHNQPADERSISWAGFSMSKETFEKVKSEVREMRKRIVALAQADTSPDRAYHLNLQLFPVSKPHHRHPEGEGGEDV